MIQFKCFDPQIKVDKHEGFVFKVDVPESEWNAIADVNNPIHSNKIFTLLLLDEKEADILDKLEKG